MGEFTVNIPISNLAKAIIDKKHAVIADALKPINQWIDWHYTPECPYPVLDGDPLVHVRFRDGSTSMGDGEVGAMPISYWHNDGRTTNNFLWRRFKFEDEIVAYMILDPNDHN